MPDWLDSDSLITASRGPFRFSVMPVFWDFLQEKASQQLLASSELVLEELKDGEDQLKEWANGLKDTMFRLPSSGVQETYRMVVDSVSSNERYAPQHIKRFLAKADPWLIAHAAAEGGRIVTFEKGEPLSKKPKIPDVGREFDVHCIGLWDLIEEMGFSA